MSQRQLTITRQILEALNLMDGGQLAEVILHHQVNLLIKPNATLGEFEDALSVCDANGWVTGVVSKFGPKKLWQLNDRGQAARLEMQNL